MLCFLTHRHLEPGQFDAFRAAWQGDGPPEGLRGRIYHVRSLQDPDEIVSFGIFDLTRDDLDRMRDAAGGEAEARRQERMAPFVQRTGVDGVFEVVEEIVVE